MVQTRSAAATTAAAAAAAAEDSRPLFLSDDTSDPVSSSVLVSDPSSQEAPAVAPPAPTTATSQAPANPAPTRGQGAVRGGRAGGGSQRGRGRGRKAKPRKAKLGNAPPVGEEAITVEEEGFVALAGNPPRSYPPILSTFTFVGPPRPESTGKSKINRDIVRTGETVATGYGGYETREGFTGFAQHWEGVLPDGLTTGEIVQEFPNFLRDDALRQAKREGWTVGQVVEEWFGPDEKEYKNIRGYRNCRNNLESRWGRTKLSDEL